MDATTKNKSAKRHPVVSREEWLGKRIALLEKEKQLTRLKDDLSRQLRDLRWVRIDKNYLFQSTDGEKELGELFGGLGVSTGFADGLRMLVIFVTFSALFLIALLQFFRN